MKIQLETGSGQYLVRSHAPGQIKINDKTYTASLVVTPEQVMDDWAPQTFEALSPEHFEPLAALKPEVVLLGTGTRLRFPNASVFAPLARAGVGVEVMDTAAACRTFNILASDGRRVVAALLMIKG
jgi:uncharacterized protein